MKNIITINRAIKFVPAVLLIVSVATLGVKARETPEIGVETAAVQTMCPVLTDEKIDPAMYVEHREKRIYLCCAMCRRMFLADPEAYIANLPQFAHSIQGEPVNGHAVDHHEVVGIDRAIRLAGRFHPVAAHFPIALVLVAVIAEALAFFANSRFFQNAARFNIAVAALAGIVAALLGLAAEVNANYPAELARHLFIHKWLGISTCVVTIFAAAMSEMWHHRRGLAFRSGYRIFLLVSALLVSLTGYFGGCLVYGLSHFSW